MYVIVLERLIFIVTLSRLCCKCNILLPFVFTLQHHISRENINTDQKNYLAVSFYVSQNAAEKAETGLQCFLTSTLSLLLPPPSLCITIYRSYRNNTRHYQFHLARSHKQAITLLTVQFPARVHPDASSSRATKLYFQQTLLVSTSQRGHLIILKTSSRFLITGNLEINLLQDYERERPYYGCLQILT